MTLRSTSGPTILPLTGAWSFCAQPPNSSEPTTAHWKPAIVPGTVASSLAALGEWNLDQPLDTDAHDWWYRTSFSAPAANQETHLRFDGLATLADVWLNGERLLATDNMFRSHRVDVSSLLRPSNDLVIAFRSLTHALAQKRPRPRWKTNLVAQQQLRWRRATLLGRIPGWSPPIPAVGPWRGVHLEVGTVPLSDVRLSTSLDGSTGVVRLRVPSQKRIDGLALVVASQRAEATTTDGAVWTAEVRVPNAPLWWPHTHGAQPLIDGAVEFAGQTIAAKIGFRKLEQTNKRFGFRVNDVPVYCRGACWTVSDVVSLDGKSLRRDLELAKAAGINMLRIGGTMIYESDDFYRLCDELGVMVWQDFMFANMDYPVDDPAFSANIDAEATEHLMRLAQHPSVVVYCGNSEVEQQAAMLGMPEDVWRNKWFGERLPSLCQELHPAALYVPSTPSGGALPFHLREGVAHYYGVGAYQRMPVDVRKDDVAFSPECLGFANVPAQTTLDELGDAVAPHDPRWKQRVPRDTGPGWDFDDVRDFYLGKLFDVDPVRLRSFDPARYLQLSRVVPGEMMTQVFSEWRSSPSRNRGGLVWFYKDLWPGAGWGIVDSRGRPKATYYYLRRVWQPRQITITDEGLEGLHLHVVNETSVDFQGNVELVLMKDGHVVVARQQVACTVAARSTRTMSSDAILQGFYDAAYAYRFGPPKHDVAIATLLDEQGLAISDAYWFPVAHEPAMALAHVTAEAKSVGDGFDVTLTTDRFLYAVSFDAKGLLPENDYFHLSPLRSKTVRLTPIEGEKVKTGYVEALNLAGPVKISAPLAPGTPGERGRG